MQANHTEHDSVSNHQTENYIWLERADLPKFQALCVKKGVEFKTEDTTASYWRGLGCPSLEYADWLAENVLKVTLWAVQPNDRRVLAMCERVTADESQYYTFVPDTEFTLPIGFKPDYSRCDKCKARHGRGKIYLVNYNGVEMQVGGACAKQLDIITAVSKMQASIKFFFDEFNGDGEEGMGFRSWYPIHDAITIAIGQIAGRGYVSAAKANGRETTKEIVDQLVQAKEGMSQYKDKLRAMTDGAQAMVKVFDETGITIDPSIQHYEAVFLTQLVNYWRDQRAQAEAKGNASGYTFAHNCYLSALCPRRKTLGFLCYAIKAYLDALQEAKTPESVKAKRNEATVPLDDTLEKVHDLPGVWTLELVRIVEQEAYGYYGSSEAKYWCLARNETNNGVQFTITKKQHNEIIDCKWTDQGWMGNDDLWAPGVTFKLRAGVKGTKGDRTRLTRAKVTILQAVAQ